MEVILGFIIGFAASMFVCHTALKLWDWIVGD